MYKTLDMKQAAIIARVSTQTQNYERQLKELEALAKEHGYTVPKNCVYAEKISGFRKVDERLELNKFLEDIRGGKKVAMVYASEISRIAREPFEGHKFIEELVQLRIPVYIQNMKMASLNSDGSRNSMFFIIVGILLEFARTEAEYTRARMKSGKLHNFKEGRNIGGEFICYGYTVDKKDDEKKAGKLIIHKAEAAIVKKVFKMYLDGNGLGMKVISNHLNELKIPTRTGVDWSISTVNQMLKNPIYHGTRIYKDKAYEGIVPAIISKETFDAAQRASDERNMNPERNVKYLYLLKDKCRCGYCGSSYVPKFKERKHSHYMCTTRYNKKKGQPVCEACGIGITFIESIVWELVRMWVGIEMYLKENNENVKKNEADIKNLELKLKSHELELSKRNEEKRKWQRLFVTGKVEETDLNSELDKINITIKNLTEKIIAVNNEILKKRELVTSINEAAEVTSFANSIGTDRVKILEVINKVLDKVIITSTKTGNLCDTYIITIFMKYWPTCPSETVLYNKRTNEYIYNPTVSLAIKYDENGVLEDNIDDVIDAFINEKNYLGRRETVFQRRKAEGVFKPRKTPVIPFTRLNTLDNNSLVPVSTRKVIIKNGRRVIASRQKA